MKRITLSAICAVCFTFSAFAQNLIVNNGATIKVLGGTNLIVAGNVTLNSGGSFDNSGRIALTGNWNNNSGGTGHVGAGEVELNGAAQTIGGSNVTTFGVLDLTGTGVKSLSVSSQVYGTLQLNDRELATGVNSITITNPAPGAVTRTIGFVSSLGIGRLIRQMNTTGVYLFPVGTSLRYRPIQISPVTAAFNIFAVRFADNNPTTDGYNINSKDADICNVNSAWYHMIERTSGTTAANITITQASPEAFDAIATWGGTEWDRATPTSTGVNTVTLSNSNFSGPYALADYVPTPVVTPGGPTTFCQSGSMILTSSAADSYLWSNGATTQSITVSASGNYFVVVTYNSAPACTSAASNIVPVIVNPNPTVFNVTGGGTVCDGGTADVSLSGSQTGVNYQLKQDGVNFGAPVVGTGNALSFGAQPGTNTYTVTATNTSTGCTSTMNGSAVVTEVADPIITTQPISSSVCKDGATSFTVSVSGGTGLYTYTWFAGPDCSSPFSVQTTSNTAATSDTYIPNTSIPGVWHHKVLITQSGSGCNTLISNCVNVVVTNDPTVTVSGGGEICKNTSTTLSATVFYGAGTCTIQWQSSSSAGGPFTDISGANGLTYSTGPLATTTYYKARLHSCSGNGCDDVVSSPSVQVLIDVTPPTASCHDFAVNLSSCAPNCGSVSITAAQVNNPNSPSFDNCGAPVSLAIDKANFNCLHVGQNIVTLTVTDENGNTSSCSSVVTVNDVTAPNALCKPDFDLALDQFGNASITVTDINNGSNDNCTVSNLSVSPTTFHCGHVGPNTVTLTVTDNHGLTATCTTVVTVEDENIPNVAPHVDCQLGVVVVPLGSSAPGQVTVTPAMVLSNSTDNCGIPTPSVDAPNTFNCSQIGIHTVVVRVTDGAGNQDTCHAQVDIVDNTAPVVSCATITVYLGDTPGPNSGGGSATIVASDIEASPATDNCGISSKVLSQTTFTCADAGTNVPVSLTVTDVNGNISSCGGTVIVLDDKDPHAFCQDITVQLDNAGNASITASQVNDGSYDNCQVFSISASPNTFTCSEVGVNNVTLTVTDKSNNIGTCTALVTVEDNVAPVVTCPANINGNPNDAGLCGANVNPLQLAYSDACGVASVTYAKSGASSGSFTGDDASGFYPVGTTSLTFTATDVNGNTASCSFQVTIDDAEAPVVTCPTHTAFSTDAGVCSATLTLTPPTTSDNCAVAALVFDRSDNGTGVDGSDDASGTYPKGQTIITWTVTDVNNITSTCKEFIQVNDNEAPVITNAAGSLDATVECDDITALANALASEPSATDNCDATPTLNLVSDVTTAGSCAQEYIKVRIWNFTDDDNNISVNFTQTITVVDNTAPEFTFCPANTTISCEDASDVGATGNAAATDNCSAASITHNDVSTQGTDPAECDYYNYTITRTFIAIDACGNASDDCVQVITVQDVTAPSFTVPADITIYADASCVYDASPTATGDVTNEDDNCATGLNATYNDVTAAGACTGSYTIIRSWTLTDYCGNGAAQVQTITVLDNTASFITCPADVTVNCDESTDTTNTGAASATDNCDVEPQINYTDVTTPGSCAGNYTITRTWTAEDDCGNDVSCVQVITVQDVTAPDLTCPADVTINCQESTTPGNTGFASATDNCGPVLIGFTDVLTAGSCPGNYTIARTWTAVDECGNESSCVQTITVQDVTAPTITCPANVTISCEDSQLPTNTGAASAADNCDTSPEVSYTDAITAGNCAGNYSIARTWTATDECGNQSSCVQTITVQDLTPPALTCPSIFTISCEDSQLPANTGSATATDNCDNVPAVNYTDAITPGNCAGNYTITRTWTATDNCGNTESCDQTIVVTDITAPVITCAADITISCQDSQLPANTGTSAATDNCDNATVVTYADAITAGNCVGNYTITRTWTATDNCGNASSCIQTITVQDVTAPAITCPADVTINCNDSQLPANTGSATATDNCDNSTVVTYADLTIAGNCPGNYTISRTWTAADNCGNTSSCVQTINVQDVTAPSVTCPADVIINCQDSQVPSSTGVASVTDNCDNNVVVTYSDVTTAGSCAGNYTITRTWTATDNCGNASSCVQVITVQDVTAPVVTCPANVTISCDASQSPNDLGNATATDNCDNAAVVTYSDATAAGGCSGNYTINRTWTATDNCGNVSSCVQVITVQDVTNPTVSCPANITQTADPNVCGATITFAATGTDNCSTPAITYSQNPGTLFSVGTTTVAATSADACGNTATCSFTVLVTDDQNPTITCPANITVNNTVGQCGANVTFSATATDNCPGVTVSYSQNSGTFFPVGTTTVTATATDAYSHTASCSFSVLVVDNTPPTAICQNLTIQLNAAGTAAITGAQVNNGSSDNCGTVALSVSPNTFTCANIAGNASADLFISEYIEGSSNNKCIEIYNGTGAPVNLSNYQIRVFANGSSSPSNVPLSGTLAAGDVYVVCNPSAASGFLAQADLTSNNISFNGDDAVSLFKISLAQNIDIFGRIGNDPGTEWTSGSHSTLDKTLRRKPAVSAGITTNPSGTGPGAFTTLTTEWDVFATDNLANLGSHTQNGGNTVTLTVTDANGNTATCTSSVTVQDVTPPAAICQNVTVNLNAGGTATVTAAQINNGSSDACGIATTSLSTTNFTCANVGSNNVTLTVTDVNGNSATCTATVTVQDATPPTAVCKNISVNLNAGGTATITGAQVNNGSSDNCGIASLAAAPNSFTCANVGANTVVLTVTDVNGNIATCNSTVTIVDNTPPAAICQNLTVPLDASGAASITAAQVNNGSSDACGIANMTVNPSTFNCSDVDGDAATDLFISEYIEGSGNIKAVEIYNGTGAPVNLSSGGYQLRYYFNGSTSVGGTIALTGTVAAGDVYVVATNTASPAVLAQADLVSSAAFFNGDDAVVLFKTTSGGQNLDIFGRIGENPGVNGWTGPGYQTTDRTLRRRTFVVKGISVNPGAGFPTLTTEWDIFPTNDAAGLGAHTHAGPNFVTFTVTDVNGNTATCQSQVTIQDVTPPNALCQNITVQLNGAGTASITAAQINNSSSDACGVASVTAAPTSFTCANVGANTVTLTVTDVNDNVSTCNATVTVQDNIAPLITCPANITVSNAAGQCGANVSYNATASDNCGISGITYSPANGSFFAVGTTSVTATATDVNGNTASCSFSVTVNDNEAPVGTCPAAVTINCQDAQLPANTGSATATDNCDTNPTISYADATVAGNCPGNYTINRTWTAADDFGNVSSCVQVITVQDVTAPTITCPAAVTINCQDSNLPANTGSATATDNCGSATVTYTDATVAGNCAGNYTINRTWTATDDCGNATSCVQVITVQDVTAPTITCPAAVTINCQDSNLPANTGAATATDNCGSAAVTYTDATVAGNCAGDYTINRTWTATDDCGNATSCVQVITVQDVTAPVITCPAAVTINCQDSNLPANTGTATATDNCGSATVSYTDATVAGNCAGNYTINRTWTATDDCGNATSCVQVITVQDVTAPTITCPAAVTINCQDSNLPANTGSATATDNCGSATVTYTDATVAGNCAGNYTINRTWTATDDCGNATSCVQVITVQDVTAPTITCPASVTINCQDSNLPVNTGTATATDNCGSATVTYTDATVAGNCAGNYTINRTWTATDDCGNATSCVQVITVQDVTAPTITCPAAVTINCQDSNLPANTGSATATDNCGSATVTYTDATVTGNCAGNYTINRTWTATDDCGNVTSCVQVITVQDVTVPTITCPAAVTINCQDSNLPANTGTATATDNCGSATVAYTDATVAGNCTGKYTINRTWTATDDCGNTASCVQVITVQDITAPTITCPASVTINCQDSNLPANTGVATATDNCGSAAVTYTDATVAGNCAGNYTINRTWTATDDCGNATSCVQVITVQDVTAPTITCPAAVTINCQDSNLPANTGTATATDNCGSATVAYTDATVAGNCAGNYTINRTWTATDDCGNTASCVQVITVQDVTAPTASNPAPSTYQCFSQVPAPDVAIVTDEADNCSGTPVVSFGGEVNNGGTGCAGDAQIITRTYNVTDACGNTSTVTHTITVQSTPLVASSVKSLYACGYNLGCHGAHDGSIDVTVNGGCAPYTFTWAAAPASGMVQGQEDQSGLAAGVYKVTIKDQNNCTTILTIVLTQPAELTVASLSSGALNCSGANNGTINLEVDGGADCQPYTYQWSGTSTSTTTTTTTITTVAVSGKVIHSSSGSNGSSGSKSDSKAGSKKDDGPSDNCNVDYSSYVVGAPDNNGATFYAIGDHCVFELQHEVPAGATFTIKWRQKPGQSGTSSMKVLVSADGVLFSANAGSPANTTNETYFSQNFVASAPTRYVWLEALASPDFQVDAITYTFNTTVTTTTTTTTPGGPFSSTAEDLTGLGAGTYCVTVTDANGCSLDTCITITAPVAIQTGICNNQTVLFGYYPENVAQITTNASGGVAPYTYLWSTGETTASITVAPTATTTYTVTVTDANGCSVTGSSIVSVVDVRCGSALDRVAMCNTSDKDQCVKAADVPAKLAAGWKLGGCGGTSLEWQCSNGLDDDANGLKDCADPSCWITNACGGVNPNLSNGNCGAPVIGGCACDGGIKSYTVRYNGPAGVTIKAYANSGHSGLLATFNSVANGALLTVNASSSTLNTYTYFEVVGNGPDVAVYTGCGSYSVSGTADQVVSQTGVTTANNAVGSPNSNGAVFTNTGNVMVLRLAHTLPAGVQYKIYWKKSGSGSASMKVSESGDNSTYAQNGGTPVTTTSTSFITTTLTAGIATKYLKIESMSSTDFYVDAVTYSYDVNQGPGITAGQFVTVSYVDLFNSTCSADVTACSICEPSGYLKLMAVRYYGPGGVMVRARNYPAQSAFQTFYNVQNGDELIVNGSFNGGTLDYITYLEVVGQPVAYANIPTDCNNGKSGALIGRTYGNFKIAGLTDNKNNTCNMDAPCACEGGISYLGLVYTGPAGGTVNAYASSGHQTSLGSFGPLNTGDTIIIRADAADLYKFNNNTYFEIEGFSPDIVVPTTCGSYLENVQFGTALTVFGWIDKEENLCNMNDQPVCPCYNGVKEITIEYEEYDSNTLSNATVIFYADQLHQDTIARFEDVDVGDVMTVWAGDLPGGIFPPITYIQVTAAPSYNVSGNATAVTSSSGVSSTANAIGAPNNTGALFSNTGNNMVLDLGGTIPAGGTYTIYWKRSGGTTASMKVLESADGITFVQNGTTHTTTSTSYVTVTKIAAAPTRYVKIESLSSTDFYVDAVTYTYTVYQNVGARPDVKFKTSCAELEDLVGETVREFFVQGIIDGDGNICDNSCGIGRTLMCHVPHSHGSSWSSNSASGHSQGSRWHHYNHHLGQHGNSNWGEASIHAHTHCVKNKDVNKKLQTGDWTLGPCPATAKPEALQVDGEGFMLMAAPNPFNEATTIRFRMTAEERVSVIVYNVAGEQIANLFDGVVEKDKVYETEFRADMNADGMYFYRLVTESGDVFIRKLIQAR